MSATDLHIEPLHPLFGARVHGVDLARPLDAATLGVLREAFETSSVLVFEGQRLEPAEQVRFSETFGPPVARPLVRTNPCNGERALYIASHAVCIEGMGVPESRRLLDELLDWCTREHCVYRHRWAPGDLVMWDNRCTMHRGRPWDAGNERRVMTRSTVIDTGYDDEPAIQARAA